ncbi:MAG: hypothetical protein ACOZF0_12745 [Thermodesulfobacteriota bacterium]
MEQTELAEVRAQFDAVIVRHIQRLLELQTLANTVTFTLSSISCLLLIVERENEIRKFPASPPKRYTRETFFDDLADIGLEVDDDLMLSFQTLVQHGYVAILDDDRYHAQISAFALVSFLDNLFPGMTGLNLVGYILQMINEVISNRKKLQDALEQFDQTLLSQGIPLSKQKLQQNEKETLKKHVDKVVGSFESRKISEDVKSAFTERLSRLRSRDEQAVPTPKVYQSVRPSGAVAVQELFPKRPVEQPAGQPEQKPESEPEFPVNGTAVGDVPDSGPAAAHQAALEAEQKAAELAAREAQMKAAEIAAREAEIRAREAEIRARELEIQAREAEMRLQEKKTESPPDGDELPGIEKKIEAFQENLAMECPLCHTGRIRMEETETRRKYYTCSNGNCGFISWGKPHAFSCPLCRNSFLVEFTAQDRVGLKCPRATCSFSQNHLGPPIPPPAGGDSPQKRRKLVRVRRK